MELTAPSGASILTPAVWYSGAGKDPGFLPGVYRFSFGIPVADPGLENDWMLFFPQAYGNALRVSVGGQDVGTIGDMDKGDSNIWNPGKVFRLKPGLVGTRTSVVVEIHGRYEAGFTKRPYLMGGAAARRKALFFRIFTDLGVWGLCGAILSMGLVILVIGLSSAPRVDSRFLFGLAAVLAAIFLTDFMSMEYLPLGLLAYKRMVASFRHLSAAAFAMAVCCMFARKRDPFVIAYVAFQAVLALLVLLPRNMPDLKRFYNYSYLGIFPILVYLPVALFLKRRVQAPGNQLVAQDGYGLLLFGSFAGMGSGIFDAAAVILRPGGVCLSHYGFFALFLSISAYVVLDILGHFKQLDQERMRSERYQQESLRDHLTEAFNRKVLPLILEETRMQTAVLMLDLDDFKGVNDSYGHRVGDLVLKDLVATVRRAIRQTDYLVRLGGDEFVVFLPGCPQRKMEVIAKHILDEVGASRVPVSEQQSPAGMPHPRESYVSYRVSIGTVLTSEAGIADFDDLQTYIAKADEALYTSKTSGKAKATFG